MSPIPIEDAEAPPSLETLVADIVAGRVSAFEILRSAPTGDYWAHVQVMRLFHMISHEPGVIQSVIAETNHTMVQAGIDPDNRAIKKELQRKDGERRFPKLVETRVKDFRERPSLLTGSTFEACLTQYKALIAHVEKLWADACQLYILRNFPLAAFLSILAIEEVGKLARLVYDLMFFDVARSSAAGETVERSHRQKHFVGVVSGALINARLDRVLGNDVVRKVLHEAESGELEKTRQSCLYVDVQDGRTTTPADSIDAERARVLTVLAGELMAEVLGHFSWEFYRMLDNVIAFERAIGMPEEKIKLQ